MKGRKNFYDPSVHPGEFGERRNLEVGLEMYLTAVFPAGAKSEDDALQAVVIGYWEKANHIHRWFVRNVQNGDDNCDPYPVSREQLQGLLTAVNTILDAKQRLREEPDKVQILAQHALPRQEGFFFGHVTYAEEYYEDLKRTREMLEKALSDEYKFWSFIYQSSW
jgi:hypothetical protein